MTQLFKKIFNILQNKDFSAGPGLNAYQCITIAECLSSLCNTPEQALTIIDRFKNAQLLFQQYHFSLPKNILYPKIWRYLAAERNLLLEGGFIRILKMADKIEPLLLAAGIFKELQKHFLTMPVLMDYALMAFTGLPLETLKKQTTLFDRARLFFLKGFTSDNFHWFQRLLSMAQDDNTAVPDVFLEGQTYNLRADWYLIKMPPQDPRFGVMGKLTGACLNANTADGQVFLREIVTNPNMGIYVICKKTSAKPSSRDPIVAATYVLRLSQDKMLISAIFGSHRNGADIAKVHAAYTFFNYLADYFISGSTIQSVYGGKNIGVPHYYFGSFTRERTAVLPKEFLGKNPQHPTFRLDIKPLEHVSLYVVADNAERYLLDIRLGRITSNNQLLMAEGFVKSKLPILEKYQLCIQEAFKAGNDDFAMELFRGLMPQRSASYFQVTEKDWAKKLLPCALVSAKTDTFINLLTLFDNIDHFFIDPFGMRHTLLAQAIQFRPDRIQLLLSFKPKGANPLAMPTPNNTQATLNNWEMPLTVALRTQSIHNTIPQLLPYCNFNEVKKLEKEAFNVLLRQMVIKGEIACLRTACAVIKPNYADLISNMTYTESNLCLSFILDNISEAAILAPKTPILKKFPLPKQAPLRTLFSQVEQFLKYLDNSVSSIQDYSYIEMHVVEILSRLSEESLKKIDMNGFSEDTFHFIRGIIKRMQKSLELTDSVASDISAAFDSANNLRSSAVGNAASSISTSSNAASSIAASAIAASNMAASGIASSSIAASKIATLTVTLPSHLNNSLNKAPLQVTQLILTYAGFFQSTIKKINVLNQLLQPKITSPFSPPISRKKIGRTIERAIDGTSKQYNNMVLYFQAISKKTPAGFQPLPGSKDDLTIEKTKRSRKNRSCFF